MSNLNYEQDIRIEPGALDVEWVGQAELMGKYARHAAETKRAMDEAKEHLEAGKARLDLAIRKSPQHYDLGKTTEGSIQSTILLQPEYQAFAQAYIDAKYEYEIAIGAVRAMDQRKTALENLVKLLAASYFAGPQAPRDLSGEWVKEQERKAQNTKVKVQRKKKE